MPVIDVFCLTRMPLTLAMSIAGKQDRKVNIAASINNLTLNVLLCHQYFHFAYVYA